MFFLAGLPQSSELCSELNLLIMLKKFILSLLTALLIVGFSPGALDCAASVSSRFEEGCIEIIVQPRGDVASTSPRMPSAVRIEAYYYDWGISSVCSYLTNAGSSVAVVLSNLDTGETVSCSIPGSGFSDIPISAASGVWVLTYTLSSGKVYEGTFIL